MVIVSKIFKFIIFAGDTNLFCTSKDIVSLSVTISNELMKLKKWFALNKLSLNITKTNYMIFCKIKYKDNIQISIGNKLIGKVNETKLLGVIIDDQLNWQSHIKQIVTKLHKNYYIIKKVGCYPWRHQLCYIIVYVCHICFTVVKFGVEPVYTF